MNQLGSSTPDGVICATLVILGTIFPYAVEPCNGTKESPKYGILTYTKREPKEPEFQLYDNRFSFNFLSRFQGRDSDPWYF
jgi:hypothetical protein